MTNIAKYEGGLVPAPDPEEWKSLKDMAASISRSGIAPEGLRGNVDSVLVTLLTAREMGLPPMAALQHAYVVKGKPQFSTQLLLALAYERIPGFQYEVVETTAERATVRLARAGQKAIENTFTMEQARKAGVLANSVWQSWGEDMLVWSATRKALKRLGAGMGWVMAMPSESEVDESDPAPEREESRAVVEEASPVLAAALQGPVGTVEPEKKADEPTPDVAFKQAGERIYGVRFTGKGAGERLTNFVNAVASQYKIAVNVKSWREVTSDEWPPLLAAALDYEAKRKERGIEGTPPAPATEVAGGQTTTVAAQGSEPPAPPAAKPSPPPVAKYVEKAQEAAVDDQADPEALKELCSRAEKEYKRKGQERVFLVPSGGTLWFVDEKILGVCGYTQDDEVISQDVYAVQAHEIIMLRRGVQQAIDDLAARDGRTPEGKLL